MHTIQNIIAAGHFASSPSMPYPFPGVANYPFPPMPLSNPFQSHHFTPPYNSSPGYDPSRRHGPHSRRGHDDGQRSSSPLPPSSPPSSSPPRAETSRRSKDSRARSLSRGRRVSFHSEERHYYDPHWHYDTASASEQEDVDQVRSTSNSRGYYEATVPPIASSSRTPARSRSRRRIPRPLSASPPLPEDHHLSSRRLQRRQDDRAHTPGPPERR
jgi:hypothetical protein